MMLGNSWTEWLANLKTEYVIAASAVLLIIRLFLGRYKIPAIKSAAEIVESVLIAVVLVFLVIRPFIVQAFFIPSDSMVPTLLQRDHILVNKFVYRFKEPERGDIIVFKSPPWATNVQYPINDRDWNVVIGKAVSPHGAAGEVEVELDDDYSKHLGKIKELYAVQPDGEDEVLRVDTASSVKGRQIIKFLGIDDAEAAESLAGAQLRVSEKDYIKRLIGVPGDVIEVRRVGTDEYGPFAAVFRNGDRLKEPYLLEEKIRYDQENTFMKLNTPMKVPEGKLLVMGDNRNNSNDSHVWGFLDRNRVIGKAMVRFYPLNRVGFLH